MKNHQLCAKLNPCLEFVTPFLLSLLYFDPVRFTIVDPMHNIYLGSGKHVFKVWINRNLITLKDLEQFEEKMKKFKVPSSAGRLPLT